MDKYAGTYVNIVSQDNLFSVLQSIGANESQRIIATIYREEVGIVHQRKKKNISIAKKRYVLFRNCGSKQKL